MKGAGEIGFTIVSISLSLVAVFIPLLLMGGIVGRLFHEFAVTVAVAILVSTVVSLTLTPMMARRLLRDERRSRRTGPAAGARRAFERLLACYAAGLDIVLRHRGMTLLACS